MRYFGLNKKDIINKTILVGLTFLDEKDEIIEQYQTHGKIDQITEDGLLKISRDNLKDFYIPFDRSNLYKLEAGEYRERGTGLVIVNPDYMSTWSINIDDKAAVNEYKKSGFKP